MKRIISILLCLMMAFVFTACSKNDTSSQSSEVMETDAFVKPNNYATILSVKDIPEFNFYLDEDGNVLAIEPLAEDAKTIAKDLDLDEKDLEQAIESIINKGHEKGYINDNATVSFSIEEIKNANSEDVVSKANQATNKAADKLGIQIVTSGNSDKTEETSSKIENTNATSSTQNKHIHTYSSATCTQPKKCSCGATSGKALGHKWTEANCKAPKTCSVCKTIDGDKGKHEYSENTGICYICNEKDANFKFKALENTGKWIYSFNKTDIYEGNILVVFTFDFSVPGISWMVLGKEATPEEASNESIYTYDYNGKTYISLGGNGEYMEYEENGSEVTATYTGSYDEPKIYFKRTANDTLKIIGIDKEFPYEEHFVIGVEIKTSN